MAITRDLLDVLRCPHCVNGDIGPRDNKAGQLEAVRDGTWLVCQESGCGRKYPIKSGIPAMLIEIGTTWANVDVEDLPHPDEWEAKAETECPEQAPEGREPGQGSSLLSRRADQWMENLQVRHEEQIPSREEILEDPEVVHEFDHHRFPVLTGLAQQLIAEESPRTAVDIGSGRGVITARLRAAGVLVTSFDLNRDYLLDLRKREDPSNLVQGDSANLPFADASFDLVVATDVIEHVPLYEQALRGCGRIASKGVLFSTSLHGVHRVVAQWMGCDVRAWDERIGHLHVYRFRKLMRLLSANLAGFQLSRPVCLFVTPFYLSLLTLNYRLPAAWTRPLFRFPDWLATRFPVVFGNWIALRATRSGSWVPDGKARTSL